MSMLVMQNILYGLFGDPHRPIKNFFRKNTRSSAFLLGALFLGLTNTHAGHQKWKTIQSNINKSDLNAVRVFEITALCYDSWLIRTLAVAV